jgi:hypothetical protein
MKNLTLKRLQKILKKLAPSENVGECYPASIVVKDEDWLGSGADFYVSVEGSSLCDTLNGYVGDWSDHTALTEALDEYDAHWEWYNSCEFNVYIDR